MGVMAAEPIPTDAVAGPFLTTSGAHSLRTFSQTVTHLRLMPMKWASGTTSPLSLPLLITSLMALVPPTGNSWE